MKLLIKRIRSNQSVTICDEDGAVLPDQISVGIKSIPDDILTATVVLAIGNDVILACDDRGPCFLPDQALSKLLSEIVTRNVIHLGVVGAFCTRTPAPEASNNARALGGAGGAPSSSLEVQSLTARNCAGWSSK
jgi:hypothetical protein